MELEEHNLNSHADELEEGMTRSQAWNLYTSHFLSTWNARTYEFAAVSKYREDLYWTCY
jgi:iron-regulated transporter 1